MPFGCDGIDLTLPGWYEQDMESILWSEGLYSEQIRCALSHGQFNIRGVRK
jgi:hypothetical protein